MDYIIDMFPSYGHAELTEDSSTTPLCRDAGVYVGISQLEYARISLNQQHPVTGYYATGAHLSVASGRISFTFGLRGPAVSVDTACSSSVVTAHLAAQAIRQRDIAMAASLGVNLTLLSSWTLACNRAGGDACQFLKLTALS